MDEIRDHRCAGRNKEAYILAKTKLFDLMKRIGDQYVLRKQDMDLARELIYELTIVSYYVNKSDGLQFYDIMWLNFGTKFTTNLKFYLEPLKYTKMFRLGDKIKIDNINQANVPRFPCNPSIVNFGTGFLVNLRLVNTVYMNGKFLCFPSDSFIRSDNILLHLDGQFNIISQHKLIDFSEKFNQRERNYRAQYQGMEDCRLFWNKDGILSFSCCVGDTPSAMLTQALGRVPNVNRNLTEITENELKVELELMPSPINKDSEKNWLHLNDTTMLYGYNPLMYYDIHTHGISLIKNFDVTLLDHRGSAGVLFLPQGQLSIVHSHIENGDTGRIYLFRFVLINEDKLQLSRWFYLKEPGVEFVTGLCQSNNDIIISFGFRDHEDWFIIMPLNDVIGMLIDPLKVYIVPL